MDREQSFLRILEATANMQFNIALMLEAKALEAQKSRTWICRHMLSGAFESSQDHLKKTLEIHEKMVEVIDGITRMENGLGKNLKIILRQDEDESSGIDGFGSLFGTDFGG